MTLGQGEYVFILYIRKKVGDQLWRIGLQEVEFDIPEDIGGVQVGKKEDLLFVTKGRITGFDLTITSGFKLEKNEKGEYQQVPITDKTIALPLRGK